VPERVVVGLGRGQTAAVRHEAHDAAAGLLHVVDDLHRRHVVDARVEADLVEQDDAGCPGLRVGRPHRVAHVGCRDERPLVLEAVPGDLDVKGVRKQTDREVAVRHLLFEVRVVAHVARQGSATGVAAHQLLRLGHGPARNRDLEVGHVEQVTNHRPGHQSRAEDQSLFRGDNLLALQVLLDVRELRRQPALVQNQRPP
jgi:hypothetical protein